jgi:hypothetical protein
MTKNKVDNQDIHVAPVADLRKHLTSRDCWCKPVIDEEYFAIVIHKSMDEREAYETGKRKVS